MKALSITSKKYGCTGWVSRFFHVGLIGTLLSAAPAHAANQWCSGTLSNLYIDAAGTVLVAPSWRGDYVQVCNINQANAAGITPTTCVAWVSLMRSAVSRSAQTIVYYSDAPACNAMPTYGAAPSPSYLMLKN